MNIVIVGIGKIGMTLAGVLAAEGNDVTLIDKDAAVIEQAINSYDVIGYVGNGVNFSVQRDAGVNRADVVIATAYSDEINMLCCLIAKKLGAKRTVARIRDPEYSKQFLYMLDEMGIDMVVNPEMEAAGEMSRLIRFPSAIGIDTFAKGHVDLAEMKIPEGSVLDGVAIMDIPSVTSTRILVCAVQHGDEVYIPNGHSVLHAGDRIHFTSSSTRLADFFRKTGLSGQKIRNIFIIGGGRISYYLAKQLLDLNMTVTIVEKDEARCAELSELLPKAHILCGDGTDQLLLKQENFEYADACVAATGIDEENIIISMYAKHVGVKKIITKINKASLTEMLTSVNIDSIITPKNISADLILRYVRAMSNTEGSRVETLYKIVDDRVEALEFVVTENAKVVGKPIRELNIKKNVLISCIIRKNDIIIACGSDVIKPGDHVIVTTIHAALADIDDILG